MTENISLQLIKEYIAECKKCDPQCFSFQNVSIEDAILSYLFLFTSKRALRESLKQELSSKLEFLSTKRIKYRYCSTVIEKHPWLDDLQQLSKQLIFYIQSVNQLCSISMLIETIDRPVIVLLDDVVPEKIILPQNLQIIELEFFPNRLYRNSYLEEQFPLCFEYANMIAQFLKMLQPLAIVCIGGHYFQHKILQSIGHIDKISVICLQERWPIQSPFPLQNTFYDYYFTWSPLASIMFESNGDISKLHVTGYPFNINTTAKTSDIVFLLNREIVIVDSVPDYIYAGIIKIATLYPNYKVLVGYLPCIQSNENWKEKFKYYQNINVSQIDNMHALYADSRIIISDLSSMELDCLMYGCIPFVFDYEDNVKSNSLLSGLDALCIATSGEEFIRKIGCLLNLRKSSMLNLSKLAIQNYNINVTNLQAVKQTASLINQIVQNGNAQSINYNPGL